jgi:HTH-type transcriptional regulator, repressor for puuD
MVISERVRLARESHGLSKNQLAKLAGISQSYVSDIEAGKKNPTLDVLDRICSALGMSVVQLLSDPSEGLPPDLLQLIETAKKLTPEERKKLNDLLQTILERTDRNE